MIVRAIADAHGGTVGLESTEGVGTTLTIRLPAVPAEPAGAAPEELQEVA